MPIEEVAEILEPTPMANPNLPLASTRPAPSRTGRRKSRIGPRLAFVRAAQFWAQVFHAVGAHEDAQQLENQFNATRSEGRLARDVERADEQASQLQSGTIAASHGNKPPRRP